MSALAITGMGVVSPTGQSPDQHWSSVMEGRSGIRPIGRFDAASYPVRVAGQVEDYVARGSMPSRFIRETDRFTQMGLSAADAALQDAALDPAELPEYAVAVVTASSSGGTEFGQKEMERLYQHGPSWVSPYQSIAWFYAATSGQISIRHGAKGPAGVLCAEQAGGLDAVALARRLVRDEVKAAVVGGTDASLCPYGLTAQLTSRRLSTVNEPERAYRPFDASASGYVPGEGGAMLIVESVDEARRRGARIHGTVLGHAAGFDPAPWTGRPSALRRTMERALDDAGIGPRDVDVVFADGMAVPADDADEAAAIGQVFGGGGVAVTVPKALTGRLHAGGGGLDLVTALLAMRHGRVPHTAATTDVPGSYDLDLVLDEPRRHPIRHALVLARGHGGFVSAVVLGA
ncbi:ketosynthase chain-length factor [Nonomuraea pusilla]|uniref:Act minimal PKS chain-length factor (CLF/KS beta) n=1 Tax=Nonomuraea pusilla TaxID=46177 RepID=A0A1H8CCC0_9ACTN|nr:ketosynthase chain-length factor [Nonomuraea pusilla]SEM92559.1 act minimal PKS chain-length factor (CLF/KS beta) [Nonomuraea pusilla]